MDVLHYWPSYCEENIWHLCAQAVANCVSDDNGRDDNAWAVLISNAARTVYFRGQKAGRGPRAGLVWDYPVIYVYADPHPIVFDHDCVYGPRLTLEEYLALSFPPLKAV